MAFSIFEWIEMAFKLLLPIIGAAARWILEPSSTRRSICAQSATIEDVPLPPPPPPPHDNNCSTTIIERSGSWDIIETASYDETIEGKILQEIEPHARLAKSILHSGKYRNGDRLTEKDEKDVMENLLQYHSGFEKKNIGCEFSYIMVDRHVEYKRRLYVVQTDGSRMDFSYRKCLRGYVEHKYPSYAERFVQRNRHLVK